MTSVLPVNWLFRSSESEEVVLCLSLQLTMGKQGLTPSTQQTKSLEQALSVSFVPFLSLGNTGRLLQMSQAGVCVGVCDRPTTTTILGRLLA